ncbi:MAG: hypothetical protein JNL79_03580 [Myxococcales bacterium]|nr:hypothetical protein [Myxococcales bacterium]
MVKRKKSGRSQRTKPSTNRRGALEVVEKRLVARAFNDLIASSKVVGVDGRTEKRRARLLRDLAGDGVKALKPIHVLGLVRELMELGETLGAIRKVRSVPRPRPSSPELVALVARLHVAYAFPGVVYRFVGVGDDVLARAGVVGLAKKRGRPKRSP